MKRHLFQTIFGFSLVVLLAACGGDNAKKAAVTATAAVAATADTATVTAIAVNRQGGSASSGNPSGNTSGNPILGGNTTTAAGGKGGFIFATLPAGGAGGSQSPAGTPRGTVTAAGSGGNTNGTPAAGRGTRVAGTPPGLVGNTFTDPQGRYTFTVPQGWRVQSADPSAGIDFQAAPATLRGAFQIAAEEVGTGITIDDYATGTMASIQGSVTNYQPVSKGVQQVTIGGLPGRRFDFTGTDTGSTLRAAVFVVKKGTTAYGFLIAATPEDFDTVFAQAKQMLDTFAFL